MTQLLTALVKNASGFSRGKGFDPNAELEACRRLGIQVFLKDEPGYPSQLAGIPEAPELLYVRGAVSDDKGLALVGTRRPTPYGLRCARIFAGQAAQAGVATVSGLARGVDTAVHETTLEKKGITWAVLGHGLASRLYPPENRKLAERIVQSGGALISEYPLYEPPLSAHFPRRNRIISGLSWAVGVIEGGFGSGALITARCALDQGRDVLAVPGPIDEPMSSGPNDLLYHGAIPLVNVENAVAELVDLCPLRRAARLAALKKRQETTANEKKILKLIGSGTAGFDRLVQQTQWPVGQLSTVLMELELKSLICALPGQSYAKK